MPPPDRLLPAIGLRMLSALMLGSMYAVIKLAEARGAGLSDILFFREFGETLLMVGIVAAGPGLGSVRTQRIGAHAGRTVAGLTTMAISFAAVILLPLAESTTLQFTVPIFATVLGAVLLGEPTGSRRWAAVLAGFVGVLIVVRPGFRELQLGHLAALACAFFTAANTIVLRSLSPREHRMSIFATVTLYGLILNAVGMVIWGSTLPSWPQVAMLAFIGTLGGLGHLTFIGATKLAPANQVAPAQYTQMLWALALGAAFYGEYLNVVGLAGLVIMIGAGILNLLSPENYRRYVSSIWAPRSAYQPVTIVPLNSSAKGSAGAAACRPMPPRE